MGQYVYSNVMSCPKVYPTAAIIKLVTLANAGNKVFVPERADFMVLMTGCVLYTDIHFCGDNGTLLLNTRMTCCCIQESLFLHTRMPCWCTRESCVSALTSVLLTHAHLRKRSIYERVRIEGYSRNSN